MPYKSEKQRRAMHAAASGSSKLGIPQAAARRFIAHSKGGSLRSAKKKVADRAKG